MDAHLAFPAWAVHLAPMYLINTAYSAVLDNPSVAPERRLAGAIEMSNAALLMIEGQEIDLSQPPSGDEQAVMLKCYQRKSGALYASAARVGATFCGAGEDDRSAVYEACMNLGLSYQYLDDVADVEAGLAVALVEISEMMQATLQSITLRTMLKIMNKDTTLSRHANAYNGS